MVYLGKTRTKGMYINAKPELFRLAREHRNNPTEAEFILWKHLRKLRGEGFVFRRQHPIDIFIADFYCHNIKLVVEIDGDYHMNNDVAEYDNGRTGELERFGVNVIRFKNEEVLKDCDKVISKIRIKINDLASPVHPSGDG